MTKKNAERWWDGKRPLSGVFEGGGAKGIAYAGALQAVSDAECWFTAVAGASAGAITAAMVASGLAPEEIAKLTPVALNKLRLRPVFRGLLRLRRTSGYLDISELRKWLTELVEGQYQKLTGSPWRSSTSGRLAAASGSGSASVTFLALLEASGIELNVVAADLTARQQIVFNAVNTPYCSVVDAVLASSAIPGVFENADLVIDGRIHTIVDGGVQSNFPMFVFSESYRKFSHEQWISQLPSFFPPKEQLVAKLASYLDNSSVSAEDIRKLADAILASEYADREPKAPALAVGFTLEKDRVKGVESLTVMKRRDVRFVGASSFSTSSSDFSTRPAEWDVTPNGGSGSEEAPERSASRKLFWRLLAPLRWVLYIYLRYLPEIASGRSRGTPSISRWIEYMWRLYRSDSIPFINPIEFKGRWPEPSSRAARWLVAWIDDVAGSLYRITYVVIAWLALAVTTGLGIGELWRLIEPQRVQEPGYMSWFVMLAELFSFVAALTVATISVIGLFAFVGASFGIRVVRRVGYGLVRTYVAGTGAPPWSGYAHNEHVIRLPISHSVTTLSFDITEEQQKAVMDDAYTQTSRELAKILAKESS